MSQFVALGLAQEMPADARGRGAQLGQHLLRVVLTDVHQAGADGRLHGLRPEPLGHGHDRHRTGPGAGPLDAVPHAG